MRTDIASDVMNRDVLMVRDDMTLEELSRFFTDHEISGAPVVDRRGTPIGVVSVTDMVDSWTRTERKPERGQRHGRPGWVADLSGEDLRAIRIDDDETQVADIMTPTIYTVPEDTPASQMAKTMIAGRIHRLFVTRSQKIVGIVTSLDLLRLLCADRPERADPPRARRVARATSMKKG